jgi:phosphatidylinositol glycan class B
MFYGGLTIVPWNFIRINIFEGHSESFGSDPLLLYIQKEIPLRFHIFFPCVILGLVYYIRSSWAKKQSPFLAYYSLAIIGFLSLIKHKESKFILPVFPAIFLMIGSTLASGLKTIGRLISIYLWFGILIEIVTH